TLSKEGETAIDVVAYAAQIACQLGAHVVKVKLPAAQIEQAAAKKVYDKERIPIATLAERVRHVVQSSFNGRRIVIFSGGEEMDSLPMRGTVVIGEGERDEAPMLYIGEKVGQGRPEDLEVDIAVDPLEGTNLCATGSPGAIAVLAASNRGGLLHAPDCYMEKIVVGPGSRNAIDLDAPADDNL